MAACPVAAIRVETRSNLDDTDKELADEMALSPKKNGWALPFPRQLTENVWYVGHHNEHSFGAVPYLTAVEKPDGTKAWVMIDSPRYSKASVDAVTSLTGLKGPDYLLLTHVDDTADHGKWKDHFGEMKRIFHSSDLGPHNWLGDTTLERVEILLEPVASQGPDLQAYDLDGNPLSPEQAKEHDAVVLHTPGHSPGSISLHVKSEHVIFTGDTLGYTTRSNSLTGFPQYGNDRRQQEDTLSKLGELDWKVVAPGHGHARDYPETSQKAAELQDAIAELSSFSRWRR